MQHNFVLTPVSTGKIFCSTYTTFQEKGLLPTTPLPRDHPFWNLWKDHLVSLIYPGNSDTAIDALVALERGDPDWKDTASPDDILVRQRDMRAILSHNPPDVILLSGMNDYGFHRRQERFWPFICINEDYVDLWMDAKDGTKRCFGLVALLRASIDHELGHWVQTLVSTTSCHSSWLTFM